MGRKSGRIFVSKETGEPVSGKFVGRVGMANHLSSVANACWIKPVFYGG